tara:strand:+ start:12238 stop:15243 length:3006 start_codon:yes stop_codon:yes gene_type:complete
MASINQRIPNFLGGVSQQPDKIKFPGQLRVCDNAVPDITFGLKKRPPAEFIGKLTNANTTGHWYDILRDGDEKYIVQITPSLTGSMPIRVWDIADGTEKSLTNSSGDSIFSYLSGATSPYSVQTIQDYTLIANPNKTIGTTGTTDAPILNGDYSFARLDTIAYNTEYVLYTGSAPTPNTYYRVTSIKVDVVQSGSLNGATFDDSNEDGRFAGSIVWSFTGGQNVTTTGAQVGGTNITEGIEGSLQVNAQSFIKDNIATYQASGSTGTPSNSGSGADFIGYTQDYDTRYTATVTLKNGGIIKTSNTNTAQGLFIDVALEGQTYRISVEAVEEVTTYDGVSNIAYHKTPRNPSEGYLSMATILKGLASSVNSSLPNVSAEVIGSGLFLNGTGADGVNFLGGAVNENMSVIGQKAQDISRLPAMCKQGYVAQISNTADLETDDYYVKFFADNGSSGVGSWEETVRPHNFDGSGNDPMVKGLDPATMPHALINNRNGTFTFVKLDLSTANSQGNENYWKDRQVGDDVSNPFPSFNGQTIQELFFHRNRFGIISNEQVVLSQPGGYFNFFIVSAIAASDDNPIDITVSDIKPAFVNHTLPIQKGLMLFSDNAQFILFTESDIFSPKTARLKKIASYECDASIDPVDLGTSVLFTSNVSAYARAFEATVVDDDVPPSIIEQTRVVPEFLPKDITKSTNSAAIGITSYGKKGDDQVYHYKYYNAGQKREQSAWYSWTLTGTMQHMLYTAGSFFTVTKQGSDYILSRHEYVADANANRTYVLGGVASDVGEATKTARWFEPCLDSMAIPSSFTYTAQGGSNLTEKTVVTIGYTPTSADNFFLVGLSGNDGSGNSIAGMVRKADAVGTNSATFNNLHLAAGAKVAVGYKYTTLIELPTYYFTPSANVYDMDGELRISGINFELGVSGPMEFHISSTFNDMADFVQFESGMITNATSFNTPPSELTKQVRVPLYKKTDKYRLQIQIPDPFSTALLSASWDGNYNPKRHVRR